MKKITEYFRNALTAQMNCTIDFKTDFFETVEESDIQKGHIDNIIVRKLANQKNDTKRPSQAKSISVLVALKVIKTEVVDFQNIKNDVDELTSIMYLPANLHENGILYVPDDKFPWIPREFMQPMLEAELSIGHTDEYDFFLSNSIDKKNQITCWQDYFDYAVAMYETVTKTPFNQQTLNNSVHSPLDGKMYIFLDNTVNASFHIKKLYDDIIKEIPDTPLYKKFIDTKNQPEKPLVPNSDLTKMRQHCGQMGGEYPLSTSQRESLNHLNELGQGDILAVNGPPGTGKTTLLQSVVANMYTQHALRKDNPPIIVASSTNNQAVTNIIDSFGKINEIGIKNLEKRWIKSVHSFATYFPSKGKIKEAKLKNYQYMYSNDKNFINVMDVKENILASKMLMLEQCNKYFNTNFTTVEQCKNRIHFELTSIQKRKNTLIDIFEDVKVITNNQIISNYMKKLMSKLKQLEQTFKEKENVIDLNKELRASYCNRIMDWEKIYSTLPWYVKLLKFIPYFKNKIYNCFCVNKSCSEVEFLIGDLLLEEIQAIYREKITNLDQQKNKLNEEIKILESEKLNIIKSQENMLNIINKYTGIINSFKDYNLYILDKNDEQQFIKRKNIINEGDIEKINLLIDTTVRYTEFWLAVHYYECRWLEGKKPNAKQLNTNIGDNLVTLYERLAFVSPCLVMTFFMLPKQFLAYDNNEKKEYYMYNYIDLLIVDEAGQTSPEIAAPSFALAKKAIVVGDENQIPPVWGINKALDISMAIKKNVINKLNQFPILEKSGLNTSESSVMKVASYSCSYNKYGNGLFLSEHRRCYNEIIEYCNDLIYNGNLEPLRGLGATDCKNPIKEILPQMGYKDIRVEHSVKSGCSRCNHEEAREIVCWLEQNYDKIVEQYKKQDSNIKEKDVLAIITPFTGQVRIIKKYLNKSSKGLAKYITVGTVHTFQGAERKIIIFSSTYGKDDGCFFIDKNESLMNVAVSRAKDSFLIFGSIDCLGGSQNSASGMLKNYCNVQVDNDINQVSIYS